MPGRMQEICGKCLEGDRSISDLDMILTERALPD